jgi:lipopolysaccharide export system protein LptA
VSRRRTALALVATAALVLSTRAWSAREVEITSKTGDVISEIARASRTFKLAAVPADVRIQADSLVFDYGAGELFYRGNVSISQGDVNVRANELAILFEPGRSGTLRSVRAEGDVHVTRGKETATGDVAMYDPDGQTIVLSGGARIGSGPNSIEGEQVVVQLREERTVVEGGTDERTGEKKRVRAVIDPDSVDIEELLD